MTQNSPEQLQRAQPPLHSRNFVRNVARNAIVTTLSLTLCSVLPGCQGSKGEELTCDDILPASAVDFRVLQNLIIEDEDKGCSAETCHNKEVQRAHLRLDTPELVYEEMSQNAELNYALLYTAEMPEHGTPWSADDLLLFRSWYCNGAFPP